MFTFFSYKNTLFLFISQITSSLRQLVIQYVRYRAARGAKFHSVDWASLPNLPACPMACKRRMSSLRSGERFNNALMKLCNMLSEQYVKHLEKYQNMSLDNGCKVRSSSREGHCHNISNGVEHTEDAGFEEKQWDDFDDRNIERALEDVLRLKQMAKLEASKRVGPAEDCSNVTLLLSFFFKYIYAVVADFYSKIN